MKEIQELKLLLREIAVRSNVILPSTEEEEKWFDDKFDHKKSDICIRLDKLFQ